MQLVILNFVKEKNNFFIDYVFKYDDTFKRICLLLKEFFKDGDKTSFKELFLSKFRYGVFRFSAHISKIFPKMLHLKDVRGATAFHCSVLNKSKRRFKDVKDIYHVLYGVKMVQEIILADI